MCVCWCLFAGKHVHTEYITTYSAVLTLHSKYIDNDIMLPFDVDL